MAKPKIRCAIYTRKSSDEGLDQAFNSLDAQHEACAAYIASQRHEGWVPIRTRFDDGGVSGGTLDRPALQALLAEIDAGRIGMVVVYKIDRLTRSLSDFAKLVDRFDAAGCSFVSVTQAFNTASSMGRLTLNVLLSFAQFEREVTAERIRDKIAASKKKGFWMGGNLPLGYDKDPDPEKRTLVINKEEAKAVQTLFELYARHGSLSAVRLEAERLGLRSKIRAARDGTLSGGSVFSNGQIRHLLRNPIYIGRIRHKERSWPGLHPRIIDEDLWNRVQTGLDQARRGVRCGLGSGRATATCKAPLVGKLFDETGDRLTPTHTVKDGRRHRYYVSNRLIAGGVDPSGWRLPASALERTVAHAISEHLRTHTRRQTLLVTPDARFADGLAQCAHALLGILRETTDALQSLVAAGKLCSRSLRLTLDPATLAEWLSVDGSEISPDILQFDAPLSLRRRGVETKIVAGAMSPAPNATLVRTLLHAHEWARQLRSGTGVSEIARKTGHSESFIRTRTQLAFLNPRLQIAILDGTQPQELTLKRILRQPVSLDWEDQERLFGAPLA
jgi:site-specific DNA recombinase